MGRSTATGNDLAQRVLAHSFTATGQSGSIEISEFTALNVTLSGTFVGTVFLQRSFDGGTTWHDRTGQDGVALSYTAPVSFALLEAERGALYRLDCRAYTSGTVTARLSY